MEKHRLGVGVKTTARFTGRYQNYQAGAKHLLDVRRAVRPEAIRRKNLQ